MYKKEEVAIFFIFLFVLSLFLIIKEISKENIISTPIVEKPDSLLCLTASEENIPIAKQRLGDLCNKLSLADCNHLLDSLPKGWIPFKSSFGDLSGLCTDDYSLNEIDDCWNQDALCKNGKCVKFEDIGWAEEDFKTVNNLKNKNTRKETVLSMTRDFLLSEQQIKILGKILESEVDYDVKSAILSILTRIKTTHPTSSLIKAYDIEKNNGIKIKIIMALRTPDNKDAVPFLIKAYKSSRGLLKLEILNTLAVIGDPRAIDVFKDAYKQEGLWGGSAIEGFITVALNSESGSLNSPELWKVIYPIIMTTDSAYSSGEIFQLMLGNSPLFKRIYNSQKLSTSSSEDKRSISFSVFHRINTRYNDYYDEKNSLIGTEEINSDIDSVLQKREKFKKKAILSKETNLIAIAAQQERLNPYSNEPLKKFAKSRGVTNIFEFQGPQSKNGILANISNSWDQNNLVIWYNGHGTEDNLYLNNSVKISPQEMGDSLIGRESKSEGDEINRVIIVTSSCFGYDFSKKLLDYVKTKIRYKPIIVTASNQGRVTINLRLGEDAWKYEGYDVILITLDKLRIPPGDALLGEHILAAEKYSNINDPAVFFGEGYDVSEEIATNSFNHDCVECEGDSCPFYG